MGLFDTKYLNAEQVKGFDNYKYQCVDTSPIAVYVSHPFWNWFVNFYPEWVAPNVLTLAGAALVMGCYFFVSLLDPLVTANSYGNPPEQWLPGWVWIVCAVCTFAGHTLDGTDGKQARRTGASGPTGELFDHGLDSWATVPFTITIFSVFGQGAYSVSPVRLLGILISGLCLFYLFVWYVGHQWFQFYVVDHLTFATCFEISFYTCCVLSFIMSFYNIYLAYFVHKTGKQANVYEFALPMVSPTILFASSVYWALHSPTNVIDRAPRLCRRRASETVNGLLRIYLVVSGLSTMGVFGEHEMLALQLSAVLLTAAHVHYGVCLVRQLCDHFHIYAFDLSYLKRKRQE
ncbi:Ethanolaminephosphotransferase 1 [Aphelenchoides fujianensis]|nr:Ethanolaminephosphotransferase 1 [Aphelenchoides fujianensis]